MLTLFCAGSLALPSPVAGDSGKAEPGQSWSICDWFDLATFYQGGEGALIESLAFAGRLQADAAFFHEAPEKEYDSLHWRRSYNGFRAKFRGGFTLYVETEFDLNDRDPLYERLTDAYLSWMPDKAMEIRVGKQTAGFTLDGKTASRTLLRPERSVLSYNLWFPDNFHSGITAGGEIEGWVYDAGYFSSSGGPEFGDFDAGFFGVLSLGRDIGKALGLDKALIALDYVHNDEDAGNFGTRELANVLSLNGQFERGNFGVWADLAFADGYRTQSDLSGLQVMPFYNLTKKWQLVASYNYVTSEEGNGVRLDRYENGLEPGRAGAVHEFFGGVNTYICGHKLKWQNGVEYTTATGLSGDRGKYDGWGYTSAVRMYW